MMMLRLACLSLSLLSTGCYPIYKQLQRDSSASVADDKGVLLEGAQVALITSTYPYGRERTRELVATDAKGVARFEGKREWRMETFFIHGAEEFFWNWCIEKPGYQTFKTTWSNATAFVFAPSSSLPAPARP